MPVVGSKNANCSYGSVGDCRGLIVSCIECVCLVLLKLNSTATPAVLRQVTELVGQFPAKMPFVKRAVAGENFCSRSQGFGYGACYSNIVRR